MLRCKVFSGYEPPWGKYGYISSYVSRKELMDKIQMDTSYATLSPKVYRNLLATVQHSRGEISICFLSLQTQDSRAKFTSQIHLFICTIFLFKLYLLIVLNFATNKTHLKLGVVFILDFFHAQSTDLKQFGYSFISILWITLLCSRLQKEQSEGCINNNKVDGVMW